MSKIYITAMGAVCAAGLTVKDIMESLYSGKRNPQKPVKISVDKEELYPVFEIESLFQEYKEIPSRTERLLLASLDQCLIQAGLERKDLKNGRIGICIGTTTSGATRTANEEQYKRIRGTGNYAGKDFLDEYRLSNPSYFLKELLGTTGPQATIVNACSSGSDAVGMAAGWIESGLCDYAIAGGADELSRISYLGFQSLQIYSSEPCRPFDKDRRGLNLGEGSGLLFLEKENPDRNISGNKNLIAGKRTPLAEFSGYSSQCDAYHLTAPHPEGRGMIRSIEAVLKQAGISKEKIAVINSHGTATPTNDRVESLVIKQCYLPETPVAATKSFTGHTLGAAGALEAIITIKNLQDKKVSATPGFNSPEEGGVSPVSKTQAIRGEYGISHSLAFGGNNSALLLKRSS